MKKSPIILLCFSLILLAGCSSVKGLKNFANCDFAYKNITNVQLASIDVSHFRNPKDLSYTDFLKLIPIFKNKSIGLNLNANINVTNPNQEDAKLEGVDYIIWIDDKEMVAGQMDKNITIGANQTQVLSLPVSFNLLNVVSFSTLDAVLEFVCGLACDNPDASRVKISLKPYFNVKGKSVKLPFYVTVGGNMVMPKK